MNEETALTQPNAAHAARLALCGSKVAKVRYACESLVRPSTSDVLAFLVAHDVVTDAKRERSYVSTQVNRWRKERGQGDTDDVPPMSDEMLTELDNLREHANASTNSRGEQESEHVNVNVPAGIDVHVNSEHTNTNGLAVVDEHANGFSEHANSAVFLASEHANERTEVFTNARVLPSTEPEPTETETGPVQRSAEAEARRRQFGWQSIVGGVLWLLATGFLLAGVLGGAAVAVGWWHAPVGGNQIQVAIVAAAVGGLLGTVFAVVGTWVLKKAPESVAVPLTIQSRFYYVGFLTAVVFSGDTSWRFFTQRLSLSWGETLVVFLFIEIMLAGSGFHMRWAVTRPDGDRRGLVQAKTLMWLLCAGSAVIAIALGGSLTSVFARFLAPIVAVVALHYAIGVDLRQNEALVVRAGGRTAPKTPIAKVIGEWREQLLSRMGLADEDRTAAQIRKTRSLMESVRVLREIAALETETEEWASKRRTKLKARYWREWDRAEVSKDPQQRQEMERLLAGDAWGKAQLEQRAGHIA